MNRARNSASAADDMTAQIICEMLRMAPLLKKISSLPAMNMWPPARLRAFGLEWYDALLWIARTISLARYVSIASSCVAIKSKFFLHSSIIFSVGFACWEASELRAGSSSPSSRRDILPLCILRICPIIWLNMGIWFILSLCWGGVLETG
jgi:hypothetical protein